MTPVQTFIAHMITMVGVIVAATVLAVQRIISGNEALLLITAVSGVTLGAVVTNGGAVSANTSALNATASVAPPTDVLHVVSPTAVVAAPATAAIASPGPGVS